MKIILTEIRGDKELESREFQQSVIRLGRDNANDIVFARELWPTVSRLHAEIRLENGLWFLTDRNSKSGTFLNGDRISSATQIQPGAMIQFGQAGPKLRFELADEGEAKNTVRLFQTFVDDEAARQQAALRSHSQSPSALKPSLSVGQRQTKPTEIQKQQPIASTQNPQVVASSRVVRDAVKAVPILICESGSPTQVGARFVLKDEKTVLGRDAAATIPIDAAAPVVSRRHAEIRRQNDGSFVIVDLGSFNGTLVNGRRIGQPTELHDGDGVQFAGSGPVFRFIQPIGPPRQDPSLITTPILTSEISEPAAALPGDVQVNFQTIVSRSRSEGPASTSFAGDSQRLFERVFDAKRELSVGRDTTNDIQLEGLLISKRHARFISTAQGVVIEDVGSTNGVYVNGQRVKDKRLIESQDLVQIGPFVLRTDSPNRIVIFDTRSKTRLDAIAITETIPQPSGRSRTLLDEVSLAIEPNEFIGVLGPSGAGKSVLLTALNGIRPTTSGRVLINNLDLYQHLDSFKQSLGYVPQDDIIYRELTVYRTLYYVARLRLSRDVPAAEIENIISEVLDVTGLTDRRNAFVSELSGGQRKRVSIAVELITKPSVIFLDEPTSGLDPATEERIMKLFRQITESGRTVILTTHAMENVRLFDRIVLLLRGRLVFYGTPSEALAFTGASNFIDLYNKLAEPIESRMAQFEPLPAKPTRAQIGAYEQRHEEIAESVAEDWKNQFRNTPLYNRYIEQPLTRLQPATHTAPSRRRFGIVDAVRQWITLTGRYTRVLGRDKWNLFILLAQAPVIGLLIYLVVGKNDSRDFIYFILALVSIWFGTSVAARELVRERRIFERERMINLSLSSYVGSKVFVLSFIVGIQTILLFGLVKAFHFAGLMSVPGYLFGLPQGLLMILTGIVGIALGLFISALVKTSEVATSLVPLILIPQILFAGLVTVPTGVSKVIGATMPATWSFDELKRLSSLDTLKEEGSDPNGPNQGLGLYRHLEESNSKNVKNARTQIEDYNRRVSEALSQRDRSIRLPTAPHDARTAPAKPIENLNIGPPPSIPEPEEINEDLSNYVNFKHPWGGVILDPLFLIAMFLGLLIATLITLRVKDIR